MAPSKNTRAVAKTTTSVATLVNANVRKSRRAAVAAAVIANVQDQNVEMLQNRGKRKADHSPLNNDKIKRSALGNLTNNVKLMSVAGNGLQSAEDAKLAFTKKKDSVFSSGSQEAVFMDTQTVSWPAEQHKITTRATARNVVNSVFEDQASQIIAAVKVSTATNNKEKKMVAPAAPAKKVENTQLSVVNKGQSKPTRRISNEFNKTEDSLYMSALEDISSCESIRLSGNFGAARRRSFAQQDKIKTEQLTVDAATTTTPNTVSTKPKDVKDFDLANWDDPFQVSHYAMDIFNYLKSRESDFVISDYIPKQVHLNKWMRSLLIDWMVEVQETFELNHETLYLAVKIVDLYLCRVVIHKDKLQLLGAAALFIACKFDERVPPMVEDFLYICDGAYKHDELIKMEMETLKTIDFDLGVPLSYRFLRRYARCAQIPMTDLTLARYVLEMSLMDYSTIQLSDSQLACASLFIALRMRGQETPWSSTLQYYSGYKLADFAHIVPMLNENIQRKPKPNIKTIRKKYSHQIFHEVAKVPLLSTEKLFENNLEFTKSVRLDKSVKA